VDASQEEFWQKAKTNLQADKVRMRRSRRKVNERTLSSGETYPSSTSLLPRQPDGGT
jgi:hypothetical protein